MARSVYKICKCRTQVKCRHPWWFSVKHRGGPQIRKSLDVVLEKHVESKTIAEQEAERLRLGMIDDTLPARTRELLGLPASTRPTLPTLTIGQLLKVYSERHVARSATVDRQGYQIGIVARTVVLRPTGGEAALGEWPIADVTADTLERLREARVVRDVHTREKGSNLVGGKVAANRDLRLLRAAFNWAIDKGLVERTPFKRGEKTIVKLTRDNKRSRRLQAGEEERLLPACSVHLRGIVEAAIETGCRKGELLGLQWLQVQLAAPSELWLPADKTKTGEARRVPISTRLRALLEMRRDTLRSMLELKDDEALPASLHVFGNEIGEPVAAIKTSWLGACSRAKIYGLHFHDLRREAGSRWMEAGVPLATIQKWLGHTNIAQTSTYLATTTAGEHEAMRRYEERIGRVIPVSTRPQSRGAKERIARLIPVDMEGAKGPQNAPPGNTKTRDSIQQNTTKH